MEIINRVSDLIYKIFDTNSNKVKRVHLNLRKRAKVQMANADEKAGSAEEDESDDELFYPLITRAAPPPFAEQPQAADEVSNPAETAIPNEP